MRRKATKREIVIQGPAGRFFSSPGSSTSHCCPRCRAVEAGTSSRSPIHEGPRRRTICQTTRTASRVQFGGVVAVIVVSSRSARRQQIPDAVARATCCGADRLCRSTVARLTLNAQWVRRTAQRQYRSVARGGQQPHLADGPPQWVGQQKSIRNGFFSGQQPYNSRRCVGPRTKRLEAGSGELSSK